MRIRYQFAAILLILTALLSLSGCKNADFKQASVSAEQIPPEIRQHESLSELTPDPVWRASYEQDGYKVAVAYYLQSSPGGGLEKWSWYIYRDGRASNVSGMQAGASSPGRYEWNSREYLHTSGEDAGRLEIWACGWAWDRSAQNVIGTTTQDRIYEGPVVNGYWLLLDLDVEGIDRFETVSVLDQSGKVLRTLDRDAVFR